MKRSDNLLLLLLLFEKAGDEGGVFKNDNARRAEGGEGVSFFCRRSEGNFGSSLFHAFLQLNPKQDPKKPQQSR